MIKIHKSPGFIVAFINMCAWVVTAFVWVSFFGATHISPASQNIVDPRIILKTAMKLLEVWNAVLMLSCLALIVFNFISIVLVFKSNRNNYDNSKSN